MISKKKFNVLYTKEYKIGSLLHIYEGCELVYWSKQKYGQIRVKIDKIITCDEFLGTIIDSINKRDIGSENKYSIQTENFFIPRILSFGKCTCGANFTSFKDYHYSWCGVRNAKF